jgi:ADP-ribose pyrophosphatase YjhB (NUDIX family)
MTDKFDQKLTNAEIQRLNRFGLGAFIFIFNRDFSKILLIRRNEEKRKKYGFDWGLIGGKLEPGESLAEGVIREAREEIGLVITKEQLNFLFFEDIAKKDRAFTGVQFNYAISIDENTPLAVNEESDGYVWFPIDELPESMGDSKETVARALNLAGGKK